MTPGNFVYLKVTAPADASYMKISMSTGVSSIRMTPDLFKSENHQAYVGKHNITKDSLYSKYKQVSYPDFLQIKNDVDNIKQQIDPSSQSIIDFNKKNYEDFIEQALRPYNQPTWGYKTETPPLTLIHFSDIHGGTTNLQRIIDFYNMYSQTINDIICSGDIVPNHAGESMEWWNNITGTEKIMLCIGNHDALSSEGASSYDWSQRISQQDQYSKFIFPYYSHWNLSSDPSAQSLTYFYKDYNQNNIRIIFINCMLTGSEDENQQQWLSNVLSNSLS